MRSTCNDSRDYSDNARGRLPKETLAAYGGQTINQALQIVTENFWELARDVRTGVPANRRTGG